MEPAGTNLLKSPQPPVSSTHLSGARCERRIAEGVRAGGGPPLSGLVNGGMPPPVMMPKTDRAGRGDSPTSTFRGTTRIGMKVPPPPHPRMRE
jgi:hypothetical protein